jgi:ribonucleoside-triphosphate reductase
MHIHNLDMMSASSAGWDILQLASLGFGLPGQIQSRPPKHLDTLLAQLVNLVGTLQNEWSSAQSLSHFDTCLAPFVKKDNLTDSQIRSALETFVFGLNTPSRWGTQPPFANVVFDWNVPEDWKEKEAVIGDFSIPYGQCQAEMHRIQQQFFEIFLKGDVQGRGFPYPIPVIRTGKNPDFGKGPYADALFACAAKYGSPQFSRLDSMMEGYFSYKAGRGNIGAVTLNLPKIAYASQSEEQFFQLLDHYAKLAFRSLDTKRKVLDRLMEGGLFPYTKAYMHDFHACYGSLGIVGLNEALVNASFLDDAPTSAQAQAFCLRMLHHLRQLTEAEPLCNFQASPAEGVSQRLAKLDRQAHPDIVTAGTPNQPYYTNGVHLAADATADVFEALSLETDRLACFDGGSLFSLWMKDALEDGGQARHLTESILKTFDIDVFCLTPVYTICPEHGWHAGEGKCPKCGQEGQTWVRVSGYYRPLESCNQAKQQEFKDRIFYTV